MTEFCCCFRPEANISSGFFSHRPRPFTPTTFYIMTLSTPSLKGGSSLKIQGSSTLTATCTSKTQYAILASKGKDHQSIFSPNYTIL